ncbi:MAG: UDP-N-acetylglucosamine 1-carboxyvinyltransferase, partial [Planctomycetota bacterium]
RTMRASVCVLGPMLARRGYARVSMPGGCVIGDRPIDLHLRGLRAMGAQLELEEGDIVARAPAGGLRGARIFLGGPFGSTVLGTANILSAACLARGETVIESAACEPEIVDLAQTLSAMGAQIEGAGSPRIRVQGVQTLDGVERRVIPDRIEAATFMAAVGAAGGEALLENCPYDAMAAVVDRFTAAGLTIEPRGGDLMRAQVRVARERERLGPTRLTTQPHPGFPTDAQAQAMAMLALADGISVVTEKIFPERFLHVAELSRMGASLFRQGPTVVVEGVASLRGAPVMASDIRASAGLVVAALAARGTTRIRRVYHLDRGYEQLELALGRMGASIVRVSEEDGAVEREAGREKTHIMVGDALGAGPGR